MLGDLDCYSGAQPRIAHFRSRSMGVHVLLNAHTMVSKGAAPAAFRLLLAHNPRIAPAGEHAGFDLQLSGHTHAGQFSPWTLAVRLVHAPHVAGLSREGRMQVYVSAGTGPELTLLRLVPA